MIYNNELLRQTEQKFSELRRKAESKPEYYRSVLNENADYIRIQNELGAAKLELAKAEYTGDSLKFSAFNAKIADLNAEKTKLLKNLNIKEIDLTPKYFCKKCNDTGYTSDGKKCRCFYKTLYGFALTNLGINIPLLPDFSQAKFFEKNNLLKIYAVFKKYCEKFPILNGKKNALFSGPSGVGKSFLAGCIANEIIKKDCSVIYLTSFELNTVLLKYHLAPPEDKNLYSDILTGCDLLVIDDLGTEPILKNVTSEYLLMIISERISKGNPYIITTNLNQEELISRYSERFFSRINDKKNTAYLTISGEDLRRII